MTRAGIFDALGYIRSGVLDLFLFSFVFLYLSLNIDTMAPQEHKVAIIGSGPAGKKSVI